jgi:uncharacterized protein (TIGR02001 family)
MKIYHASAAAAAIATAFSLPVTALAQTAPAAAPASPHTFTGNVGLFSQYIFRGLTETNEKPALQGGFDYSHSSGIYLGTWASNISWYTDTNVGTLAAPVALGSPGAAGAPFTANRSNTASLEWDFYGGYKGTFGGGDWNYDIGLLQYYYPGTYNNLGNVFSKPDTLEGYGLIGWKWVTLKYSQATGDTFGVKNSKGSNYLDASATIPLGDTGFNLGLHYGKQTYKGTSPIFVGTNLNNGLFTYSDWKVGLTKDWLGLTWQAFASGTNAKDTDPVFGAVYRNVYGKNIGKSQFTVGVQKTF